MLCHITDGRRYSDGAEPSTGNHQTDGGSHQFGKVAPRETQRSGENGRHEEAGGEGGGGDKGPCAHSKDGGKTQHCTRRTQEQRLLWSEYSKNPPSHKTAGNDREGEPTLSPASASSFAIMPPPAPEPTMMAFTRSLRTNSPAKVKHLAA